MTSATASDQYNWRRAEGRGDARMEANIEAEKEAQQKLMA